MAWYWSQPIRKPSNVIQNVQIWLTNKYFQTASFGYQNKPFEERRKFRACPRNRMIYNHLLRRKLGVQMPCLNANKIHLRRTDKTESIFG